METSKDSVVLPKKLAPLVEATQSQQKCKNGGASTFSYAEMGGSGGEFTLEGSPIKQADSSVAKFVQISAPLRVPSTIKENQQTSGACLKCKDIPTKSDEETGADDLQTLISELSLGQVSNAIENSTLTARILALHQQTIKAQFGKLCSMGRMIGESQKVLQCQQGAIETARKAMTNLKSTKPASIDTIQRRLDITQLTKHHNQQVDELKSIQQNYQELKCDQERLARAESELQEEIHVEQAVEDVVRLIKTNRKTALLIVQLVHRFQCDRMRDLNRNQLAAAKSHSNLKAAPPSCCAECSKKSPKIVSCSCSQGKSNSLPIAKTPKPLAVVTIDESDDESSIQKSNKDEKKGENVVGEEQENASTKPPTKKKSKIANKRQPKVIAPSLPEHTFAEVMEDIFQSVISSEGEAKEAVDKSAQKEPILVDGEKTKKKTAKAKKVTKIVDPSDPVPESLQPQKKTKKASKQHGSAKEVGLEKTTKNENPPETPNSDHGCLFLSTQPTLQASTPILTTINSVDFANPNSQSKSHELALKFGTQMDEEEESETPDFINHASLVRSAPPPPIFNYMTSTTLVTKSEISGVYATPHENHFPTPMHDHSNTRFLISGNNHPPPANYQQRRVLLQQKRQTLCEQLEQIELQQLRNEMQNPHYNPPPPRSYSIDIDEELANLAEINMDDLCDYDFDQLDVSTPCVNEVSPVSGAGGGMIGSVSYPRPQTPQLYMYSSSYGASLPPMSIPPPPPSQQQFHLNPQHSQLGEFPPPPPSNPPVYPTAVAPANLQQSPAYHTTRTFQQPPHLNSTNDFEDILDLIHNSERTRQVHTDPEEGKSITNAIYQELRLTDNQFLRPFTPMELGDANWDDPLTGFADNKQSIPASDS